MFHQFTFSKLFLKMLQMILVFCRQCINSVFVQFHAYLISFQKRFHNISHTYISLYHDITSFVTLIMTD